MTKDVNDCVTPVLTKLISCLSFSNDGLCFIDLFSMCSCGLRRFESFPKIHVANGYWTDWVFPVCCVVVKHVICCPVLSWLHRFTVRLCFSFIHWLIDSTVVCFLLDLVKGSIDTEAMPASRAFNLWASSKGRMLLLMPAPALYLLSPACRNDCAWQLLLTDCDAC